MTKESLTLLKGLLLDLGFKLTEKEAFLAYVTALEEIESELAEGSE